MDQGRPRRERIVERMEAKPPTLWRALSLIIVATVAFVVLGAVAMRLVEPETFTNIGDALWFSVVTVSTVGYGDIVPETTPGRFVASAIMIVGLAFVPAVTAIVINTNISRRDAERAQRGTVSQNAPETVDPDHQNEGGMN